MRRMVLLVCLIFSSLFPAFAKDSLKAGFAKRAINPPESWVYMPGSPYNRLNNGREGDLEVRVLVLQQGKLKIALVSLDLIGFLHEDVLKLRERLEDIFPD